MQATLIGIVVIAVAGWFGTIIIIGRSKLADRRKQPLMVVSWLPWMVLALGAPIMQGVISSAYALNIGGAMTTGMLVSLVAARRK